MLTRNRRRPESSIGTQETAESLSPERCRICLKEGDIPIFGEDEVSDISEEVMDFGNIEISHDDNLPQQLCYSCYSLLESALLFRTTAKKTEEKLKNTDYLEDDSVLSEELDYKLDNLNDTDNESTIKREYLEYKASSDSESESDWKVEHLSDNESLVTTQSEAGTYQTNDDKEIEMQYLHVKEEEKEGNNEVENDLVMIIVSDKNKANKATLTCTKCDSTFQTQQELDKHTNENHPNASSQKKKCDVCHQLVDKSSYRLHIKEHREKYKQKHDQKNCKVECDVCGKSVNKSYYKYHLKMHGTAEEQAERQIKCSLCNKSVSANYFTDHMRRVHDKKKKQTSENTEKKASPKGHKTLKCPVCDKNIDESEYKEHLAKHGGPTRRYICDKCGRVFKHPSAFKTHTLTHGTELKYQCQFCPYRGLHLGLLKIHVRTHTGDYNYKCTECPARFITKSNLSRHLERHQGICKYKCETCNKGFYTKRDVDKHNKIVHLNLKNNICDICGKGFGHRDNMLSHQLKVHKREKIAERRGRMPSYLKEELMKEKQK